MIPLLGVSGPSGSGKTTLIEKLVRELTARGLRVSTIKHHRGALDVDREGKDSARHKQAGAIAVAIITPAATAVIRDESEEPDPYEAVERYLFDSDIVIAEGYKLRRIPKIIFAGPGDDPDSKLESELAVAVIADKNVELPATQAGLRRFERDNASEIADFIKERFIDKERFAKISLQVDGKRIPMKPFVRDLVNAVIRGMVGTFKGGENARKITVFLEK